MIDIVLNMIFAHIHAFFGIVFAYYTMCGVLVAPGPIFVQFT